MNVISQLRKLLTRREKKQFFLLLVASVFISFLETFSISLVMFFAAVATNFDIVHSNKYFNYIYHFSGVSCPANFVILLGLGLVVFYCFRFIITSFYIYALNRFSQDRFHVFAYRFFQNYLGFNYKDFVTNHSSKIGKVIFSDTVNLTHVMTALLSIIAESLTVLFIYVALLYVNLKMTMALTVFLSIKIFFIIKFFSRKLEVAGKKSHILNVELQRSFNESFGNFKLIKIFTHVDKFLNNFYDKSLRFVKMNTLNAVLQNLPRLILETIGFSMLILVMVYVVYMFNDVSFAIPILSMYAMAFYRFLPSVNKILASYNQYLFTKHSLESIEEYMGYEVERLGKEKIIFDNSVRLENLTFRYKKGIEVLNSVNLTIEKGKRIAFVGESGAGKSTLADVIMGLYKPDDGKMLIGGTVIGDENILSWRSKIGYIPQTIFLFDGSVAENIVFGRLYDEKKVIEVLKKANIYDFLLTKDGINTRVGENGVMLSGGQKQRIAISRALYSDPEILVLDEATSSLDNETEQKIMNEIYELEENKTLIIIAHRLSTIARCDKIYKIEDGKVCEVDYYKDLVEDKQKEFVA